MKRNPIEHHMHEYYASVQYKKIKPLFFYQECAKCKNEFVREPMWEIGVDDFFLIGRSYHRGCTHCFPTLNEFKKYCEEKFILKKEDWLDSNGEFIEPIVKKIMEK